MNEDTSSPRPYTEWRAAPHDRAEDAAYTFGSHLIRYCRAEALATLLEGAIPDTRKAVEVAVDTALHNVLDLLEGYWRTTAGPSHRVTYSLIVNVLDDADSVVENLPISPCSLDLPIGYWKWRDREFR